MTAISSHVKDVKNASINWKILLPPTLPFPPRHLNFQGLGFFNFWPPPPKKKSSVQISHPSALKQLFVVKEIFLLYFTGCLCQVDD